MFSQESLTLEKTAALPAVSEINHDLLVAEIDRLWEGQYPEIPWLNRPLFIWVPETGPADCFFLAFDHDFEGAVITVFVPRVDQPGDFAPLAPENYHVAYDGRLRQCTITITKAMANRVSALGFAKANSHTASAVSCYRRAESGAWELIYSSHERALQLVAKIYALTRNHGGGGLAMPAERVVCALSHLLTRRPDLAAFELDRHRPRPEGAPAFGPLLDRFQLSYSGHGFKRTFKFWSEQEKQAYLSFAERIVVSLRDLSAHVTLAGGVVLGIHRDGALIDWDDDIDLFIAFEQHSCPDLAHALDRVEKHLRARGFKVEGSFFSHRWIRQNGHQTLDVFVGLIEADGNVAFYPSRRRGLDRATMFPPAARAIHGVTLPFPADCEDYLRFSYGPNFRSPDRDFNDPWDMTEFADIAGKRALPIQRTRGEQKREAGQ